MNLKNLSMVAAQILVQKLLDSEILNQTICIQTEQGVVYVRFESVNGCVKTYHTLPDDAPGTGWRPSWVLGPGTGVGADGTDSTYKADISSQAVRLVPRHDVAYGH